MTQEASWRQHENLEDDSGLMGKMCQHELEATTKGEALL